MKISTALVNESISTDMDHLPCNIIDHNRASRRRMDVPSCRIAGVHIVHGRKLLSVIYEKPSFTWPVICNGWFGSNPVKAPQLR